MMWLAKDGLIWDMDTQELIWLGREEEVLLSECVSLAFISDRALAPDEIVPLENALLIAAAAEAKAQITVE